METILLSKFIGDGANLFINIVVILLAVGAGLTTTDFLRTKKNEEELEAGEKEAAE